MSIVQFPKIKPKESQNHAAQKPEVLLVAAEHLQPRLQRGRLRQVFCRRRIFRTGTGEEADSREEGRHHEGKPIFLLDEKLCDFFLVSSNFCRVPLGLLIHVI